MSERDLHINYQSGRWTQFLSSEIRESELYEKLYESFLEKPWAEATFNLLNEDLFTKLNDLLPHRDHIRTQFFYEGPECVSVLRTLKYELPTDPDIKIRRMAFITLGAKDHPAQGMDSYIHVLQDEKLRRWFNLEDYPSSLTDLNFWDGNELKSFLALPSRDTLINTFTFSELSSFLNYGISPTVIAENSELRSLLKTDALSWADRLELFARLSPILGTLDRPYTELREAIWTEYQKINPDVIHQSSLDQTKQSMIAVNKLHTFYSLPLSIAHLQLETETTLWNSIKDSPELNTVREEEYDLRILRDIQPTLGFEWEFTGSLWKDFKCVEDLLESKGVHTGIGGTGVFEISPGPFYTPEAASLMAHLIYESGCVNPYESLGNSIHWNVGLASFRDVSTYVVWLQSTGWAYQPYHQGSTSKGINGYSHRIHSNFITPINIPFVEMKSFNFQGLDNFKTHIEVGSHLATALAAYQKVITAVYQPLEDERTDKLDLSPNTERPSVPFVDIPFSAIDEAPVSGITKQLAKVWITARHTLDRGFETVGVESFLGASPTPPEASEFAGHMRDVFPNSDSLNDRTDNAVFDTETCPFKVDGHHYPNLVAFSRAVAYKTAEEVKSILDKSQDKALRMLAYMGDQKSSDQITVREKFFADFPPCDTQQIPQALRIMRMQKHYLNG